MQKKLMLNGLYVSGAHPLTHPDSYSQIECRSYLRLFKNGKACLVDVEKSTDFEQIYYFLEQCNDPQKAVYIGTYNLFDDQIEILLNGYDGMKIKLHGDALSKKDDPVTISTLYLKWENINELSGRYARDFYGFEQSYILYPQGENDCKGEYPLIKEHCNVTLYEWIKLFSVYNTYSHDDRLHNLLDSCRSELDLTVSIEKSWHEGPSQLVLYIATCPGVLSLDNLRKLSIHFIINLKNTLTCELALKAYNLCVDYYYKSEDLILDCPIDLVNHPNNVEQQLEYCDQKSIGVAAFKILFYEINAWKADNELEQLTHETLKHTIKALSIPHSILYGNDQLSIWESATKRTSKFDILDVGTCHATWKSCSQSVDVYGAISMIAMMKELRNTHKENIDRKSAIYGARAREIRRYYNDVAEWCKNYTSPNFDFH